VLVIAGPWDSRYPQAQELTVRLGLTERVLFRHDVIEADLPALVSGARLFVFPSVHEGFGLPPLEAMQCGTPVACARVSALSEVTGDAAFPFDPFNVPGMSTALSHLLEDADLRAELADRGLRRAQLFTWERTARETMAAYLHKANP
jgi:glycosyltransferase involved in cell wall biosynthesis